MATTSRVLDLTLGLTRARLYVAAHVVAVIQAPSTAKLQIAVDHGDPVSANRGTIIKAAAGFDLVELTADPVAGGVLELAFGDIGDDFTVTSSGDVAFEAVQGAAGPDPWAVIDSGARAGIGAPGDAEAAGGNGSLVALMKALRSLLGSISFPPGAAHSELLTAAAVGALVSDVAAGLGRHARYGHVQAHPNNVGLVTVAVSHDGAAWRDLALLLPGADVDLSGLDVAQIRATFDTAGDSALVGGW